MEPNAIAALVVGGLVLAAVPSFLVAMAVRKMNQSDQQDKAKEQQVHESFQSINAEIRDERSKRENLEREVHGLELQLATTLKRDELQSIYQHIEDMRRESKGDLENLNKAVTEMTTKVIQALAAR